jgi:hypothetical protein
MLTKWCDRHYPEGTGLPRLTIHRNRGGRVDHRMRCGRCRRHVDFARSTFDLARA